METIKLNTIPQVGSEIGINDTIVQVISIKPSGKFKTVSDYSLGYPNATKIEQLEMVVSDYFQSVPNATTYLIDIE